MRIPTRFAPVLFSALLSAIMVGIISGFMLLTTQGFHAGIFAEWSRRFLTTWAVAFPTVFAVAPLVRRIVSRVTIAAVALVLTSSNPASAQSSAEGPAKWEFLIASGKLLPTGSHRATIARGGMTAAQLSFVPGPVAVTATIGWARSRDVASVDNPKLDAFIYDIGAELRAPRQWLGSVSVMPFGGAGIGGRSYNYRSLDVDATHNLAGFVSAGSEVGRGRVRLRLELRDYLTGFKPLDGRGSSATRNDLVLMGGLRIAARR